MNQEETFILKEHEANLHPRPYWKTMKTCPECYNRHNEIIAKSNLNNRTHAENELQPQRLLDLSLDYHLTPKHVFE